MIRSRLHPAIAILAMMLLALAAPAAETFTGKVVAVGDGDSVTVLTPKKKQVRIRLEGIDAPETKQAFGSAAKKSLSDLVYGREVRVVVSTVDDYGRKVAHLYIGDFWVNLAQIERGMAWHYVRYYSHARFHAAEVYARTNRLGLWTDAYPTPPWDFRHRRL
jgi:endonuclease YncB( thermonuclease family)